MMRQDKSVGRRSAKIMLKQKIVEEVPKSSHSITLDRSMLIKVINFGIVETFLFITF